MIRMKIMIIIRVTISTKIKMYRSRIIIKMVIGISIRITINNSIKL